MNLELLTPSQLPYPTPLTAQSGCQQGQLASYATLATTGGGSYQSPPRDGLFNSIFTPDDLPYPLPIVQQFGQIASSVSQCGCGQNQAPVVTPISPTSAAPPVAQPSQPAQSQAPATSTSGPPTSASPSSASPSSPPSQIVINVGVPAASAAQATATTAPSSAAPTATTPSSPTATASPPATVSAPVPTTASPIASQTMIPVAQSAPLTQSQAMMPIAPPMVPATPTGMAPVMSLPAMIISGGSPPRPSDVIAQAYSYNPRLRSRAPKAQEELLEEMLGEKITMKMLSTSAAPVAFVVPDGCNAVDFYVGAVEVNPDIGSTDDLDLVVVTAAPKLSANAQPGSGTLNPGDQITVTLPWRYASWVELAQEHLRAPITARFYQIQNF